MIDDLATWLTQIWDEEERLAKYADVKQGDPVWWVSHVAMSWPQAYTVRSKQDSRPIARVEDVAGDEDSDITGILDGGATAAHIAYHDPASVVARIAADRKILALHRKVGFSVFTMHGEVEQRERYCEVCQRGDEDELVYPCATLLLLASPYADRPGYRDEWQPERAAGERQDS